MVNSRLSTLMSGERNRGQLILIGGITIALTLIGLVVILNSTIYTQNVSPGNTIEDTTDLKEYEQTVENDLERLVVQIHDAEGHVGKPSFITSLDFYSDRMAEQTANRKPGVVTVTLDETESDTKAWIRDDEATGHLRDRNNDDVRLEDVSEFEEFIMEVTSQDNGQPFIIRITGDNGGEWVLEISDNSPVDIEVRYEGGRAPDTCDTNNPAKIDILAGTVDGSNCFEFAPGLDGPYTIEFVNGEHATGTYSIIAEADPDTDDFYGSSDAGSPYLSEEMETAVVDVHYETPEFSGTVPIEIDVEEAVDDA